MALQSDTKIVGGAEMFSNKNIIENAVNSKDHTTLVAAVKAAGLVETLEGPGPFTVFAPTNAAFDKLPEGTVDTLLKPENKDQLSKVLTYHVVAGKHSGADLMALIAKDGADAKLTTVEGEDLSLAVSGKAIVVTDAKGGMSHVTVADVNQSNGVIHVVDAVLLP
ncbi:MAG: fasciclin domain-containing protein [Parvibaculum sp.]|nr:fasciclin domain-containing protein [Parvibaculum sp.]